METITTPQTDGPREASRLMAAILIPLAAFALQWLFWPAIQPYAWFLFYPSIFLSSWVGGLRGGLAATAFSTLAVWWFFIPTPNSFNLERPASVISIAVFAVTGILFSLTHERLRRANRRAAAALLAAGAVKLHLEERIAERTEDLSRTVDALRESEARYRSLFENSHATMLVIDPTSGLIVDANPAAAAWYGWSREELCRKNISEINTLPPDDMVKEINKACNRSVWNFQFRHRRANGSVRDVETFSGPVTVAGRSLLYSIVHDITERKQAEEELKKGAAEFRRLSQEFNALLDAIPDGLMLLDREMNILWANRAAAGSIGAVGENPAGRACHVLLHERAEPCEPCPVIECFTSGSHEEAIITRADGQVSDIRTVPLADEQGEMTRAIVVRRDITEQRKLEAQYLHAQKMESVGTLAGGVAHDFNNILTTIIGYGQIARMGMEGDNTLCQCLDGILEAAERATHLTKELLLFSRKQESERYPVDLNRVVGRMERLLHRVIGEDITLSQAPHGAPLPILADGNQIGQVLMNLAVNARDAMPQGGEFALRTEQVRLGRDFIAAHGYGEPGDYALLTVSDTGVGMDAATLQRVFEPFFTTKEAGKGTGLGLAVVYGIVKQHDGFVTVCSEPGQGCTFRIYLPLTGEVRQEAGAQPEQPVMGGTETILLAEDDAQVRALTVRVLTGAGYTVIATADGEEAVRRFRDHADSVHLIFLDIIMPKMNGKEAADEIRKLRPGVKILYASGYATDSVRQKLPPGTPDDRDGLDNLVPKPVPPHELLRVVRNTLDGG